MDTHDLTGLVASSPLHDNAMDPDHMFYNITVLAHGHGNKPLKRVLCDTVGRKANLDHGVRKIDMLRYSSLMTGGRCLWCGNELFRMIDDHIIFSSDDCSCDHLLPSACYGPTMIGNIMLTCRHCNLDKDMASPYAYAEHAVSPLLTGDDLIRFIVLFASPFRELLPELYDFCNGPDAVAYEPERLRDILLNGEWEQLSALPSHFVYDDE